MNRRPFLLVITVSLLALALTVPALAGGWATITVDPLPDQILAGEEVEIGFVVRQHGIRPMEDLQPTVTVHAGKPGEKIVVSAQPDGPVGHYTARVTFPAAGQWSWSVQAFTMDQPMPPLSVSEAGPVITGAQGQIPTAWALAGLGGLLSLAGAGWAFSRQRRQLSLLLAVLGVAIAAAGLVFGSGQAAQPSPAQSGTGNGYSLEETGQRLFVSKGCVACHWNGRIEQVYYPFSTEMGPDLTRFSAAPEYLQMWLDDPPALKPDTKMPDLDLSPTEIEALIAFINTDAEK